MRHAIVFACVLAALAACGGPPANYCTGPYQLEGYVLQPDGSKTTCIATRVNVGAPQGGR